MQLGFAGMGGIGKVHLTNVRKGHVAGLHAAALCDLHRPVDEICTDLPFYHTLEEMLSNTALDAVLVATPHALHVEQGCAVLQAGKHLMMEKPLARSVFEAAPLLQAAAATECSFAVMLNQRTDPAFRRVREFVQSGRLGRIQRVHWTVTDWFRNMAYYRSADWRGTWQAEGGGVVLTLGSHQLDILQWIFGMPVRVYAAAGFGKYHDMETEDEAVCLFEYANGMTATVIISSAEYPMRNRLEVTGSQGAAVLEDGQLQLEECDSDVLETIQHAVTVYDRPGVKTRCEPYPDRGGQHREMLQNFADHIHHGTPLIAKGTEGAQSLHLANAVILSGLLHEPVTLPVEQQVWETAVSAAAGGNA